MASPPYPTDWEELWTTLDRLRVRLSSMPASRKRTRDLGNTRRLSNQSVLERAPLPESSTITDDGILVRDDMIIKGMRLLLHQVGVVTEPTGAVGVAAILEQPKAFKGRVLGTIIGALPMNRRSQDGENYVIQS